MASLYSDRLFQASTFTDTDEFVGPVPPGVIWVVRDVDVLFPDVVEIQTFTFGIEPGPPEITSPVVKLWSAASTPVQGSSAQWRGRQVLLAGDRLWFQSTGADGVDFAVSGYVLTS